MVNGELIQLVSGTEINFRDIQPVTDTIHTFVSTGTDWIDELIADNPQVYGLLWNNLASPETFTRLGSISAYTNAQTVPDSLLTIQSQMKACTLLDNGTVNY